MVRREEGKEGRKEGDVMSRSEKGRERKVKREKGNREREESMERRRER